jgi:hypothetical protein
MKFLFVNDLNIIIITNNLNNLARKLIDCHII